MKAQSVIPSRRRPLEHNESSSSHHQTLSSSSSLIQQQFSMSTPPRDSIQQSSSNLFMSNNNNNNTTNNNEDWNFQNKLLLLICTLFLLLQSYGFRNIALSTSGNWSSPYNAINHHPSWCPYATCNNTPHCKPCQRRFLIVVATGRSGSTTLMNLLDKLPNVRMAGENKGQLLNDFHTYRNLHDSIEFEMKATEEVEGAWKHFPIHLKTRLKILHHCRMNTKIANMQCLFILNLSIVFYL